MISPPKFFPGFRWPVPIAFADPLAASRFELGDILYGPGSYDMRSDQGRTKIAMYLQVTWPPRGPSAPRSKDQASVFSRNWISTVKLDLYRGGEKQSVTSTQGRLYTMLWKGRLEDMDADSPDPPAPLPATDLTAVLPQCAGSIHDLVHPPGTGPKFLMPYDLTSTLLRAKHAKISERLWKMDVSIRILSPTECGVTSDKGQFAPTAQIACYTFPPTLTDSAVERALKPALYSASKGRKSTEDQFRLSAHGFLAVAH